MLEIKPCLTIIGSKLHLENCVGCHCSYYYGYEINALPHSKILDLCVVYLVELKRTVEMLSCACICSLMDRKDFLEKERNAGYQYFLIFLRCFLPYQRQKLSF